MQPIGCFLILLILGIGLLFLCAEYAEEEPSNLYEDRNKDWD